MNGKVPNEFAVIEVDNQRDVTGSGRRDAATATCFCSASQSDEYPA